VQVFLSVIASEAKQSTYSDCHRATLPVHPNKELSPYFISDVLKQLVIPEEGFLKAIGHKH
jgi:hypothetical protein